MYLIAGFHINTNYCKTSLFRSKVTQHSNLTNKRKYNEEKIDTILEILDILLDVQR